MSVAFGAYLLVEHIARGGMGDVFLARRVTDGRTCIIKRLRPEHSLDRGYVGRLVDEARVAALLRHPNICAVFDVGTVGDEHFLAMEYVAGRELQTVQQRAGSLPPDLALSLVDDVLGALDYAHGLVHPKTGEPLRLVHRDISPQNLLVGFDGRIKLIDFGIAASSIKVERTEPNVVLGKMAYMAPEQARGDDVDGRADLFSLAIVCSELLLGARFYGDLPADEVWRRAGVGGFAPAGWKTLPRAVQKVLRTALQPDRTKRFATAAALRAALREASSSSSMASAASASTPAALMARLFAPELVVERERVVRVGAAVADADVGEQTRKVNVPSLSLLDDTGDLSDAATMPSRPSPPPTDVSEVFDGTGAKGIARVPAPGVVHVVLRGHGDQAAGAWQRSVVDREVLRSGAPVFFFSDVEHLATHDAIFRQQMTEWQSRVRGQVTQLVLFRSQLVVMAISIANKLSGGGTEVTSSRVRFDVALGEAVARSRSRL